jgi:hypothetical protein
VDKDNHAEGQHDYEKSGGQVNSNPITELFHPTYDPPNDKEGAEEYKSGWDNAKKQDR